MNRRILGFTLMAGSSLAAANVATFDSFEEGYFSNVVADGGVTLYDVDQNLGGGDNFTIDAVNDGSLGGAHSSPNVANFGGYIVGPGCSFGRIKSFKARLDVPANFGSLDFWTLDFWGGNTVTLYAIQGGNVVDSDSFAVQASFSILHHYLSVSASQIDYLLLESAGPHDNGVTFAVTDNVTLNPVPEPASLASLATLFGLGMAKRVRRR